eukprot:1059041-Prorocentrum_lima.AAC.1
MTSSLVGSEMCIRDSARKGRRANPVDARKGRRAALRSRLSPHAMAHMACLLYTSDAADDM